MRALQRWFFLSMACLPLWASAHAHLLNSEPPANALISQSPNQLRLRFSEPIEKKFVRINVMADSHSLTLTSENIQWIAETKTLLVNLPVHQASSYEVQWSILAKDGHASRGQFVFKVKSP